MITFSVPGIRCANCVRRITEGLNKQNISATVSLADKTVSVAEENEEHTLRILDDLGFDAKRK